jgi:hypothetical protein
MENLYLVKVPVAFLVLASEEHKMTNAYGALDAMAVGADELIYFGEPAIEQVF